MSARFLVVDDMGGVWSREHTRPAAERELAAWIKHEGDNRWGLRVVHESTGEEQR